MVASFWLRGALTSSKIYCLYPNGKHGAISLFKPIGCTKSILQRVPVRQCFHPGASNLARDTLKHKQKVEGITSRDMIKALSTYIWPKGLPFFAL